MYDFCVEQKCREKPNVKKKVVKKNSGKKWIHLQKKKSLLIKKVFFIGFTHEKNNYVWNEWKEIFVWEPVEFLFPVRNWEKKFFHWFHKNVLEKKKICENTFMWNFLFFVALIEKKGKNKKNKKTVRNH